VHGIGAIVPPALRRVSSTGLRTTDGQLHAELRTVGPCPSPWRHSAGPQTSCDRIVRAYLTLPRSDDNKDAVIRPGTLRFPYAQTAEW